MSIARPEDPVAVLPEEEVGPAEWGDARRLGDVLDTERGVVLALARDQRLAQRVAGLSCLAVRDRKSTRLNSSHTVISYAVFCLKKKKKKKKLYNSSTSTVL